MTLSRTGGLLAALLLASTASLLVALPSCNDSDPSSLIGQKPPIDGSVDVVPEARVVPIDSFNPCERIPAFGERSQTIDGSGQEFEGLPTVYFLPGLGTVYKDDPDAGPSMTSLEGKVAWSALGLHMFFSVKDQTIVVPAEVDAAPTVYPDGDGMQVFLGGTSPRPGIAAHDGTDPTAWHLILVPPAPNAVDFPTGRVTRWINLPYGYPYLSKLVDGGYTMELLVPWLALRPNPPVAELVPAKGAHIGFTFALQMADSKTAGRQSFSFFAVNSDAVQGNACMAAPATCPDVDDRSWCQPILD